MTASTYPIEMHRQLRQQMQRELETAHRRVEKAFLEGGQALEGVIEMISQLTGALNDFTGTLDQREQARGHGELDLVIAELDRLALGMASRNRALAQAHHLCLGSTPEVDTIEECFRYLKVFAITAKINGASIPEFAGFAEEIRHRIAEGADEIKAFSASLKGLVTRLKGAASLLGQMDRDFGEFLPDFRTRVMTHNAQLTEQTAGMARLAERVRHIVRAVEAKVAACLQALQLGDVVRQRIEHLQAMDRLLDDFTASADPAMTDLVEAEGLVANLIYRHLQEIQHDFEHENKAILAHIGSFAVDAENILELRHELAVFREGTDGDPMSVLVEELKEVRTVSQTMQSRVAEANGVVGSIPDIVCTLMDSLEKLQSFKDEIHYMALNSNLRCSKLGDAGRAITVVSSELRNLANQLEEPADKVAKAIYGVEAATASIAGASTSADSALAEPLDVLISSLETRSVELERSLSILQTDGDAVVSEIRSAAKSLDFRSNLGEAIARCLDLSARGLDIASDTQVPTGAVSGLSEAIFALYTMASERAVHAEIFGSPKLGKPESRDSVDAFANDNGEELLDAMLF